MPTPIPASIRRVFVETFTVRDIAEPLASFDASAPSSEVRACMEAQHLDIAGIRSAGRIVGFVRRESLGGGDCSRHCVPLEDATVLDESSPLLSVLLELNRSPFVFVSLLGSLGGIVTRAALQKAPVRMWLFGLLTLIEMRFTELIERHCPADDWTEYLSEGRLQKAANLLSERKKAVSVGSRYLDIHETGLYRAHR